MNSVRKRNEAPNCMNTYLQMLWEKYFWTYHKLNKVRANDNRLARTAKKQSELELLHIPYRVIIEMPRPPKEKQISDEFFSETCRRTACEFTLPLGGGHWDNTYYKRASLPGKYEGELGYQRILYAKIN